MNLINGTRRSGALILALLLSGVPVGTEACGFHDPRSIAQAIIAMTYPNAPQVRGAIWSAQQAGVLAMPDKARLTATGEDRKILDMAATITPPCPPGPQSGRNASERVVAIDRNGWSRSSECATDEPVLAAIAQGRLSLAEAVELGVMRLYGTPEQERVFMNGFGTIGERPLPEIRFHTVYASMLARGRTEARFGGTSQAIKP